MPRGILTKNDILSRVLRMKQDLYNGKYHYWTKAQNDSANEMLTKVLDIINEYSH
jgi:hypothetical protein